MKNSQWPSDFHESPQGGANLSEASARHQDHEHKALYAVYHQAAPQIDETLSRWQASWESL